MPDRVLVRHFLRELLDHDLISPHADRHQVLTVGVATLLSASLFVTVLLGWRYVAMPFQSPGRTALLAIDDRLFQAGLSMVVLALVAALEWDALAIDARDASALGPLPIRHWTIVRAKLAAVGIFGGAFALALNGIAILLYPMLMVGNLPSDWSLVPPLIGVHAAASMGAAAVGFFGVLGMREVLRAALGHMVFRKVAPVIQAGLVLALVSLFLLLPILIRDTSAKLRTGEPRSPLAVALFSFTGLHDRLTSDILERLPHRLLPPRVVRLEAEALALYRSQRPALRQLGGTALPTLAGVLIAALAAYAWNSRRLPSPEVARLRQSRGALGGVVSSIARVAIVRKTAAQAGFFFTLQVLARSSPHRLAVAVALALGVAISTVIIRGLDIPAARDIATMPVGLFMIQTLLLATLFFGIRRAVRIPAELSANWLFRLAFSGNDRPYLAGVKRAAFFGTAVPLVVALLPVHIFVLGVQPALAHAAWGLLLSMMFVQIALLEIRKLPFVAAYVPSGQVNPLPLLLLPLGLGVTYALASFERSSLTNGRLEAFFAIATAGVIAVYALDVWQRRREAIVDLDEGPAPATQRLGLNE